MKIDNIRGERHVK